MLRASHNVVRKLALLASGRILIFVGPIVQEKNNE
jgi:hypothetical protein